MSLRRATLSVAAMVLVLGGPCLRADDGKAAPAKGTAPPPPAASAGAKPEAPPSREQLKGVLREATTLIRSMADEAARRQRESPNPFDDGSPDDFRSRFTRSQQALVQQAIGRAQVRLGDLPAARASWQSALDATATPSPFEVPLRSGGDRAALLSAIIDAQLEAGERDEAKFTIRLALQNLRTASSPPVPIFPTESDSTPIIEKARHQGRISRFQGRIGEADRAAETFHQAIETADSIKDGPDRVRALVDLAALAPANQAESLWTRALDIAMAQDEYPRARAVEAVLRGRVLAGQVEEALATVADRLKGDLRSYGLWVLGDAIASGDLAVRHEPMARLAQLLHDAEFDRSSKRFKTFRRIAEAQARLGDYDGADRTVSQPQPIGGGDDFLARQARAYLMAAIARAQLESGQVEAARDTTQVALELLGLSPDNEGGESVLPIVEVGGLLARTGDYDGAIAVAERVGSVAAEVRILADTAAAQAEAGKRDEARATLQSAVKAAEAAPNEAIWNTASFTGGARESPLDPGPAIRQTLAEAYARIGDLDASFRMISRMGTDPMSTYRRLAVIKNLVALRLEADDDDGARRAADVITPKDTMFLDDRADLFHLIAAHQARRHDPTSVLDWARKENAPRARLDILHGLADGIAERFAPKEEPSKPGDGSSRPQPEPAGP